MGAPGLRYGRWLRWIVRSKIQLRGTDWLSEVLAHAADAALVIDESGTISLASDHICHMLEYAAGELLGQKVELLIPVRHRLAHIGHRLSFTDDRRTRAMGAGLELFALCKDGSSSEWTLARIRFSVDWRP
jgi:PAS domain S-box-containing protein